MSPKSRSRAVSMPAVPPLLVALMLLLALNACGERAPQAEAPLETVDVAPPPAIDPDADPRSRPQRAPRLEGDLPPGWPADLPLHLPARVLAGGGAPDDDGGLWVELATPHSAARVRQQLGARLLAAGWAGLLDADGGVLSDGERRLRFTVEPQADGSARYRLVYR